MASALLSGSKSQCVIIEESIMNKFFLFLGSVFVLLSCSQENLSFSGDWQLHFFEKDNTAQTIAVCTISLEEKQNDNYALTGFSGVNYFNTEVSRKDNNFFIEDSIMQTKMTGTSQAMEFENNFMAFLKNANDWNVAKVDGLDMLEIKDSKKNTTARFIRISLENSNWILTAQRDKDATVSVDENSNITLQFLDDKKMHAWTGVNHINMDFKLDEKKHSLSFNRENGVTTLMAASEEEMQAESAFVENLMQTASYSLVANELNLFSNDKTVLLVFERQDLVQ